MIQTYEFEGYVNAIDRGSQYGTDILVRTDAEVTDKTQKILISVSKKNALKIPTNLLVNNHVRIKFAPYLMEGVSKQTNKQYRINKNMMIDIEVLDKSKVEGEDDMDDMPF